MPKSNIQNKFKPITVEDIFSEETFTCWNCHKKFEVAHCTVLSNERRYCAECYSEEFLVRLNKRKKNKALGIVTPQIETIESLKAKLASKKLKKARQLEAKDELIETLRSDSDSAEERAQKYKKLVKNIEQLIRESQK